MNEIMTVGSTRGGRGESQAVVQGAGERIPLEFTYAGQSVVIESDAYDLFSIAVKQALSHFRINDGNIFVFSQGQPIALSGTETTYDVVAKHRSTTFGIGPQGMVGSE